MTVFEIHPNPHLIFKSSSEKLLESKNTLGMHLSPVLILMFSDFTWRRIGREKFPLSLNIIAQTLELELDLGC